MIVTHRTTGITEMKHRTTGINEMKNVVTDVPTKDIEYDLSFVKRVVDLDNIVDSIVNTFYPEDKYDVSIKNVKFNPPATVVFWSDGTKTVVKDENIKNSDSVHVNFDENELVYKVNKEEVKVDYTRWKEDGLLNAIMKKICPNYFAILDKYC